MPIQTYQISQSLIHNIGYLQGDEFGSQIIIGIFIESQ